MWEFLEKRLFFRADMAGLGKCCTGGYGRIGVYRVKSPAVKKARIIKKRRGSAESVHEPGVEPTQTPRRKARASRSKRKHKKSPRSPKQPAKEVSFEDSTTHTLARTLNKICDWIEKRDSQDRRRKGGGTKRRADSEDDNSDTSTDASVTSDGSSDREYRKARRRVRFYMGQATGKPTKIKKDQQGRQAIYVLRKGGTRGS